eukprot:TRINITY_DN527_c0_g2_i1.p1 TRINITY_DN527_c0_g2~~TRINITY_DN527_c0_g2_i1.p1  ORF type:complete len:352 (+),score=100.79 TRINITY_DN527_c0_g2_i1:339-1394(+)
MPSTKNWSPEDRNEIHLQQNFFSNLKSYETYEEARKNHDVVMKTNFINPSAMPEYLIKIVKNETLIQERRQNKKIFEEQHGKSLAKNIIVFYSDATSRQQFKRQLPNLASWFTSNKERKTHQFFRYHASNGLTYDNLWQLNFGQYFNDKPEEQLKNHTKKRIRSFLKDYKDAGYIIGHANSLCSERMSSLNIKENKYFMHEPADHDSYAFACDPNYFQPKNPYGFKQGGNSIFKRCLYGKDFSKYLLDYGANFLETYKEEKKLLWVEMDDGHEFTSERLKYLDKPATTFFQNLEKKGLIDDETIIIFLSDHGSQMNVLYRFIFQMEQYLTCLLYTSPSPRDKRQSRMPSSA